MTNETGLAFKNISSEKYRVYVFPGGDEVRIELPTYLNVSKSGGHRVLDAAGISHYIPPTWIHIYWEGSPNFVK